MCATSQIQVVLVFLGGVNRKFNLNYDPFISLFTAPLAGHGDTFHPDRKCQSRRPLTKSHLFNIHEEEKKHGKGIRKRLVLNRFSLRKLLLQFRMRVVCIRLLHVVKTCVVLHA